MGTKDGKAVNSCHSACICLNIQGMNPSLRSKSSYKLQYLMEKVDYFKQNNILVSFLAIVESWLKDHVTDAQLHIPDYNIYRCDRSVSKNGGALLYIHNSITIDNFSLFEYDICSAVVCLTTTTTTTNFIFTRFYKIHSLKNRACSKR